MIAAVLGFHPALRVKGPIFRIAREIADDAAKGQSMLGAFGFYDAITPVAFWALDISLIYLAAWGLALLCPRKTPVETGARPGWLLSAALAGHAAATVSVFLGGNITAFYFCTAVTAAVVLIPLARNSLVAAPPVARWRLAAGIGVGILLTALALPLDIALTVKTRAAVFPEAWFPLVAESWRWLGMAGLGAALAGAILLVARGHVPGRGWVWIAPAYILLLGPSNPLKGLATAFAAELIGRAGGGWIVRAIFVMLTVGWVVVVSLV